MITDIELLSICQLHNRWQKRIALQKKGISLAQEWKTWPEGFMNFVRWSLANGFSSEKVIDRIDGKKGYSPDNCRWVTWQENTWNSVCSNKVHYEGKDYPSQKELWKDRSLPAVAYHAFKARLSAGWGLKDALTIAPSHGNRWRK